ncbi:MAG TPA: MFS transporter [Bdellovibrionales bacterium]|nr:MFS transporter [Bdellovibrionales bacterium]
MKDKRLVIIFFTVFIDLVGFGIIIPLNPYLAGAFGASPLEVGLLMSVYSLMQFLFSPLWGQASDRFGRRPVILISLLGAAIAHASFGLATSLWGLILARAFAGAFGGNISAAMAYIADITAEKDRSKGMGLIGAAFGLGFICGPALGGVFAEVGKTLGSAPPLGESFPALVAGGICFANFLAALKFLPETHAPSRSEDRGHRFRKMLAAFQTPVLGTVMLLTFLNTFAMAHIEASLFLFVQEVHGWTLTQASFGFAYIGVVMVFTQGYLIRKWMPKHGERRLLGWGLSLSALGFGLIGLGGPLPMLAFAVTLLGLGNGLVNPSLNGSVSLLSAQDVQGKNLGVAQSLSSLARILGPATGGWIYMRLGVGWPFLAASAICFGALAVALKIHSELPDRGRSV